MRLLKKQISAKDGSGTILIQPDTAEEYVWVDCANAVAVWSNFSVLTLSLFSLGTLQSLAFL